MKQGVRAELLRDMTPAVPHQRLTQIEAYHRELEDRLRQLGRHVYLTPAEQVEAAEIKKRKLAAKDEILSLRRVLS